MKKPHLWFVEIISRIVPRRFRSEWKQEWEAELIHREALLRQWRALDWTARRQLLRRSLAAFWDALAMQPKRLEEEVIQDLRYGIRILLQNKGITAVAILSLALGIGANTALFSLIDAMLLKTLAVNNPDELVLFNWSASPSAAEPISITYDGNRKDPATGITTWDSFSYRAFERFRENNETLSSIFAFARIYRINVVADSSAEIGDGQLISGDYFAGLGLNTVLGRPIQESDDQATAPPVTVMGYRYWQQRFGRDPAIVGRTIDVNGHSLTVIGVAAPDFSGTLQVNDSPDLYIPMAIEPALATYRSPIPILNMQSQWWLQIMGRVKPGTSFEQVQVNFDGIFRQTTLEMLGGNTQNKELPRLQIVSGSQGLDSTRAGYVQPLTILMVIMGLVLLIACANVANLLLARAASRQREIATRMSIGATRLRLIRQLLTESVFMASLGGLLGAVFAYWGKDVLLRWGPWSGQPNQVAVSIDLRVLVFAAAVSILTGILFGLAPAIKAIRSDLMSGMQGHRTLSARRSTFSKSLLVAQVAMSIMLLIGAGLFVQTLRNLQSGELGFDPTNLLLFKIDPTLNNYEGVQYNRIVEHVIERLESLDGVRAATVSNNALIGGGGNSMGVADKNGLSVSATFMGAGSDFFAQMGIPIVLGRSFGPQDHAGAPAVVVINETLARRYFQNTNPIGKQVWDKEIIGVVRDTQFRNLRAQTPAFIFSHIVQEAPRQTTFAVRTAGDPSALVPAIRETVKQVDSNLPIYDIRTQEEQIQLTLVRERLFANFASAFGALALFLVCVGLYGVMSYNVMRRTHEIGIRMSLGAKPSKVLGMVMRETLLLVIGGVALGLALALALTRRIESVLFGLEPNDPVIIGIAILVIVATAAFSGYLPARRASRVDPMEALRYQ